MSSRLHFIALSITLTSIFSTIQYQSYGRQEDQYRTCTPYIVIKDSSDKYVENYERTYRQNNDKKHTKWIWLPKSYFLFIDSFQKSHPNYTGVKFHFSAFNKIIDHRHQTDAQQIVLQIMPTKADTTSDLDAFRKFKDSVSFFRKASDRRMVMGQRGRRRRSLSKLGADQILWAPEALQRQYARNYKAEYSNSGRDMRHTKYMYLCRDNFTFLGDFFKNRENRKYKGMYIYFASYNSIKPGTLQAAPDQITLIFHPSKGKKVDKEALYNYFQKYYLQPGAMFMQDDLNHGELCPHKCNEEL